MTRRLNVVAVSGGLQRPSRTLSLVQALLETLRASLPVEAHLIELGDIAAGIGMAQRRDQLSSDVEKQIERIESADLIIAATPVYRGSYTGLFKHLFDFVHHEALIDVPVLLAATGGSDRHALVIDHQLRPLFSFFQSRTLALGVYAAERDFNGYEIADPSLRARIELAISRALPLLNLPRASGVDAAASLAA